MISPCSPQHWWCRVTFKKLSNPSVTCQSAKLHGYSLKVCLQKASLNMKWSTTKWLQLFCHYYYTAQKALCYWDSVTCILTNFIWWFLIWKQVLYCHWKYTFYMFISTFFLPNLALSVWKHFEQTISWKPEYKHDGWLLLVLRKERWACSISAKAKWLLIRGRLVGVLSHMLYGLEQCSIRIQREKTADVACLWQSYGNS